MADPQKKLVAPQWMGRPVVDPDHAGDLDRRAAVHEFSERMPRPQAEDEAYRRYVTERRREAAGHHLRGMTVARAAGDADAARRHSVMYVLHAKALGLDPHGPVPPEIERAAAQGEHRGYRFRAHPGDYFALPDQPGEPVAKAEPRKHQEAPGQPFTGDRLRTIGRAAAALLELRKEDQGGYRERCGIGRTHFVQCRLDKTCHCDRQ